ncbi:phage tail protein [Salmonella enterica subsp. enterica serovar Derby]|nr:phage tail protein [Salmonella enterica subsp. enterica serovar Typhimurium]EBM8889133.1 phage tail protein [Salmonella enterica subsp. enterica serovar Derby]EBQ2208551.1 phage tail protein [Salmonella enterica subsp. enterica]ECJ6660642.1 phage tail protein [Salmonella enterica subsp. enterica]ECJ6667440.1 phage tail protein [Salmonella enterica subsp. enterica]
MGADKTNNIMTLSSGVSQPLLADVQYFELYSSLALNRKLKNIVLPGFYCGFEPVPGTGLSVRITSENSEGKGAASVDVNNVQISVQQIEDVTVSVKAGATNIIVLEANFEHGVKTTQVDSASSVSAARIYARTDNTIGQNQIELCRVIVPGGATAVTKEMIVLKYRVNRAVGVEFSNEISSTEERKAATPLAVKTLHDLVDTKAPLDSPHLSGTPTSPTPEPGTNNAQIANTAFVKAAITTLINGAPSTLDTLKEIAAAINNDPNFSTTINNALALKAPLASPALTGIPTAPTAAQGTNNTQIATTAYVRAAISALVGSSPEALDTLNELAAALGNDPNFATTMTNALAGKQPLDATLTALAGLPTGANKLPYFTGTDTVAQTDLTQVGRDILAKSNTQAIIQYLGLGEGSALPVGVPVPWPSATPPTGWLKCNGAPFSAEEYPKLAKVYPTNELPDLRGEFIRGWDDGRGVDAGRALLSIQTGMLEKHRHIVVANDWYDSKEEWELATIFRRAYTQGRGLDAADVGGTLIPSPTLHTRGSIGNTGGSETRPRNIAFNFIVRAA